MKPVKSDAAAPYMIIHRTPYVHTGRCPSCGCDPRIVYTNNLVSGWDETLGLETETQYCRECAMMRAVFDAKRWGFNWS